MIVSVEGLSPVIMYRFPGYEQSGCSDWLPNIMTKPSVYIAKDKVITISPYM